MKPSARIQTTIELLEQWQQELPAADVLLKQYLRARRFIGSKDRRAISDRFYSVLRYRGTLEWHGKQAGLENTPRSWVLASVVFGPVDGTGDARVGPEEILAMAESFFDGSQYGASPLTPVEQAAVTGWTDIPFLPEDIPFTARHNIQPWMEAPLKERYGEDIELLLDALQTEAPVDIRVNLCQASREAVQQALAKDGIDCVPITGLPAGLRLHARHPLMNHSTFRAGWFEIQDASSQLAALAVGAEPGMVVVDYCAGAGGKTLALADAMQGQGTLIACDTDAKRLERMMKRADRAGVADMIRCVNLSDPAEKSQLDTAFAGQCDRVLVDAPCTGSGTWRRNPHLRWQYGTADICNFTESQASILQSAAKLVQPSGRLSYATCSLLGVENSEQIQRFLKQHVAFSPLAIRHILNYGEEIDEGGISDTAQLLPHRNQMDGFFIAILKN